MEHPYDVRIQDVNEYIHKADIHEHSIVEELSREVCLSKSRLSHLFREQTGMTLHSYLAFEKLRKTWRYMGLGYSITDSCMRAGFASPSHCAATSKRMFGISLMDAYTQ